MKTITLSTKITFNATSDKYSIIEKTATGFQFKPIKFEKGLPTVPRTFEEVKEEFLSSQIDIEGFEHNDADNRLVELLMDGYIKDSLIDEYKSSLSAITSAKQELDGKYIEQSQLVSQHEATIKSHEATISEQQESIQEQKDYMQGQKDTITGQAKEITNIKSQVSNLQAELEKEKQERSTEKSNWESEKQKYEVTIEGLQAMAE